MAHGRTGGVAHQLPDTCDAEGPFACRISATVEHRGWQINPENGHRPWEVIPQQVPKRKIQLRKKLPSTFQILNFNFNFRIWILENSNFRFRTLLRNQIQKEVFQQNLAFQVWLWKLLWEFQKDFLLQVVVAKAIWQLPMKVSQYGSKVTTASF